MDERFSNYSYDGQFSGNIMVVGRTGCGKTTFIQNLGRNKMFGRDIHTVFWISKIVLSKEREENIRESFADQTVKFTYPKNLDEFNYLIDFFISEKMPEPENESLEGEKSQIDKLIVMDDVSGLADRCENFSNFLTVSRKYGFTCVYVFHTIYPGRQSWEMIMSQKHIFNFFRGSIHSRRILKTLALFASREKNSYIPTNQVWLNKLYFQISDSKEKLRLTVDTRDVNELGPGKFRASADNNLGQHCYFNRSTTDSRFRCYCSRRENSKPDKLAFLIDEQNCSIDFSNKSSDFFLTRPQSNGTFIGAGKSPHKENYSDGRPKADEGRTRDRSVDSAESAFSR